MKSNTIEQQRKRQSFVYDVLLIVSWAVGKYSAVHRSKESYIEVEYRDYPNPTDAYEKYASPEEKKQFELNGYAQWYEDMPEVYKEQAYIRQALLKYTHKDNENIYILEDPTEKEKNATYPAINTRCRDNPDQKFLIFWSLSGKGLQKDGE